jgi:FAD/FMN-containing dehydrogenase
MPLVLDPEPLVSFEPAYPFRNKHQNVSQTSARLYNVWNRTSTGQEPPRQRWRAGLNALRRIVEQAEAAGRRVRAYGGAWSLSACAMTPDFLVNTKPLNYVSIGLSAGQVRSEWADRAGRLVFAQCGLHVMELHTAVEGAGLALPTCGASNGQTIAGAVATGTHGAAWSTGAMQDFVRGIHLVTEGGRHLYVEPASAPVVTKRFTDALGAETVRDDALFNAALVSFGSFGLVHALLLETVPIYELVKYRFRADHHAAFDLLDLDWAKLAHAHVGLPPAQPYHYEVTFNPYRPGTGEQGAFVTAMYQLPGGTPDPLHPSTGGHEPSDDLLGFLGALTNAAPAAIPDLATTLVEAQLKPASGGRGTPGSTFGSTAIRGSILSAELGVALVDAPRALDAICAEARAYPFPGLAAARFVKSSPATLAFTRFAPVTCTIELPGAGSARTAEFHTRVFGRLDLLKIPFTLHWGQAGDFGPARLHGGYGPAVDAWLAQRRKLLTVAGRRTFSNAFLEQCGLAG